MGLNLGCESRCCSQALTGHVGPHDLKHLRKGIFEGVMSVFVSHLNRWWFYSRLVSEVCLGEWSAVGTVANLIYISKLVHNYSSSWPPKHILNICVFEVLIGYTDDGGYENRNVYMLILIILLLIILIKGNVRGLLSKYHVRSSRPPTWTCQVAQRACVSLRLERTSSGSTNYTPPAHFSPQY